MLRWANYPVQRLDMLGRRQAKSRWEDYPMQGRYWGEVKAHHEGRRGTVAETGVREDYIESEKELRLVDT